ncbi:hypothetical protein [Rhodococcus qingshengii]|uniref:hypothetical protein n=1 Tax=Rhodococcus qingshengii TaxID=334542 RepID=UPI001F2459DD|nr:hypothetical protein [Rhodococcus qingshengii]
MSTPSRQRLQQMQELAMSELCKSTVDEISQTWREMSDAHDRTKDAMSVFDSESVQDLSEKQLKRVAESSFEQALRDITHAMEQADELRKLLVNVLVKEYSRSSRAIAPLAKISHTTALKWLKSDENDD